MGWGGGLGSPEMLGHPDALHLSISNTLLWGTWSLESASASVPDVALEKLLPLQQPRSEKCGFWVPWLWHSRLGMACTHLKLLQPHMGHRADAAAFPGWRARGRTDGWPIPCSGPDAHSMPGNTVTTEVRGRLLVRALDAAKVTRLKKKYLDTT